MTSNHSVRYVTTENGDVISQNHSARDLVSTVSHLGDALDQERKVRHAKFREEMDLEPPELVWEEYLGESASSSTLTSSGEDTKQTLVTVPQPGADNMQEVGNMDPRKPDIGVSEAKPPTGNPIERIPEIDVQGEEDHGQEAPRSFRNRRTNCLKRFWNSLQTRSGKGATRERIAGNEEAIAMVTVTRC